MVLKKFKLSNIFICNKLLSYFSVLFLLFEVLMIKKLLVILLIFNCSLINAQTIRTDVLVIGGSPGGVAAAVQSARSKVKTILDGTRRGTCQRLPNKQNVHRCNQPEHPIGRMGQIP